MRSQQSLRDFPIYYWNQEENAYNKGIKISKKGPVAQWFTRSNFQPEICSGEERYIDIMYYVYILRSAKDNKLYTGYSDNLRRRFYEHNAGKVDITKNRRPFKLIYYEAYLNQQDATMREKFFKTQWGRNYLKKVLKNYWAHSSVG